FSTDEPRALPTAASGSSAPVQAVVDFPIYPVWLPALFSISSRFASLRRGSWRPSSESAPQPLSPAWIGADGPGFSGSLAWPTFRVARLELPFTTTVESHHYESNLEASSLTMTPT